MAAVWLSGRGNIQGLKMNIKRKQKNSYKEIYYERSIRLPMV